MKRKTWKILQICQPCWKSVFLTWWRRGWTLIWILMKILNCFCVFTTKMSDFYHCASIELISQYCHRIFTWLRSVDVRNVLLPLSFRLNGICELSILIKEVIFYTGIFSRFIFQFNILMEKDTWCWNSTEHILYEKDELRFPVKIPGEDKNLISCKFIHTIYYITNSYRAKF